jgi:nucleoside-diphosphate-sugar epimerase
MDSPTEHDLLRTARTVAVVGAHLDLGVRVCAALAAEPGVQRVLALRRPGVVANWPQTTSSSKIAVVDCELTRDPIDAALQGADQVVHLAPGRGPDPDGTGTEGVDVLGTRRLFSAVESVGVRHVVVLSSAMVYGPWPNNPVPMTEEAALRPHPALGFAVAKAEVERLAQQWASQVPGARLAVLRPTVTLAADRQDWLGRSLWNATSVETGSEPPVQFLHQDDLVAAISIAIAKDLTGPYNVAPDGWIETARVRALAGRQARLAVTDGLLTRVETVRWRTGATSTPPGVVPYTLNPWVVANDRLRSAGWSPQFSNEEAYVAVQRPGRFASLGSGRRQELALAAAGGVGAAAAGAVAGAGWLIRQRSQR